MFRFFRNVQGFFIENLTSAKASLKRGTGHAGTNLIN